MASARIYKQEPVPDRGPDPLRDVKKVRLELTANEVRALLLVANRVGGSPERSLRGEFDTIRQAIQGALGIEPLTDRRFLHREDMITGHLFFLKGGGHV